MQYFHSKNKRGITTVGAALTAAGMLLASIVTAWGASSVKVAVLEERENNHYLEVKGILERMEGTLNQIAAPTIKIQNDDSK